MFFFFIVILLFLYCLGQPLSLPIGAIGKWLAAIGKLMTGVTLAAKGEEITNAMVGNDISANDW